MLSMGAANLGPNPPSDTSTNDTGFGPLTWQNSG